jgi:hypothetical protein
MQRAKRIWAAEVRQDVPLNPVRQDARRGEEDTAVRLAPLDYAAEHSYGRLTTITARACYTMAAAQKMTCPERGPARLGRMAEWQARTPAQAPGSTQAQAAPAAGSSCPSANGRNPR